MVKKDRGGVVVSLGEPFPTVVKHLQLELPEGLVRHQIIWTETLVVFDADLCPSLQEVQYTFPLRG